MKITKIDTDKKRYLDLLLLADEQEDMIDHYLERGTLYVLDDDATVAIAIVTHEGDGLLELKNIAVSPQCQRKGYGSKLIDFIVNEYRGIYTKLQVGTGETPAILKFYEGCGFSLSHRVKNFFTDNYDHPIYEDGIQLKDMIYLQMNL